jgi:hypothetical protein
VGRPLAVPDIDGPDAAALYARKLVLVRSDRRVAWRGNEPPASPLGLIDLARGAHSVRATKAA